MGYIGRDNRLTTFTKQSITANGTLTDFTLEQGVGDSSSILVSVGGVVQQPDVAYSATGKTLSFTSAPGIGTSVWVVYLGKELHSTFDIPVSANADSQTGVGDGTTTPLTLSHSVTNPQSIIVTLNGVAQEPTTDFTVSGTTLTFTTAPDATSDIMIYFLELETADDYIHDGTVTTSSFAASDTMPAWNGSALTNLTAGNLVGNLGAFDGSNLTNVPYPIIKSTVDPTINENPGNGLGTLFLNHTTGNMWALTNATADQNVWTNVGSGTGHVENTNPSEANNPGPFTWNESASYQVIFAGATDPDSGGQVTHYKVDTITPDTHLSVSVEEVAAGQPHTFVVADVPSDQTGITFRVRAKDNHGGYSSGITVSVTLLDTPVSAATGGNTDGAIDGNYKYHIFTTNGQNFTINSADATFDYLIVAGGGGGGGGYNTGGAGGAGGYRYFTGQSLGIGTYPVTVGYGGAGGNHAGMSNGGDSSFNGITSSGGGYGGSYGTSANPNPGGSGGGGAYGYTTIGMTGAAGNTPSTSPSQGNNGGDNGGPTYYQSSGGGGGHSAVGGNGVNGISGSGGAGTSNAITGTSVIYAGGGGGGIQGGNMGSGDTTTGLGGGEQINDVNGNKCGQGSQVSHAYDSAGRRAGNGDENRGGGGGGGAGFNISQMQGGHGGDGVVIIRYRYQ